MTVHPSPTPESSALAEFLKPVGGREIAFDYTNYRGEKRIRLVRWPSVIHGTTEWYAEPQWLLAGLDVVELAVRLFAVKDIDLRTLAINDPYYALGPRAEAELFSFPDWAENDDGFDMDTGAPGIGAFGNSIAVWSHTQNRYGLITVAEAAKVFNVDPIRVYQAVEDHPWLFISKNAAGDDIIEPEGE